MAKKFLTNLDLVKNQILNVAVHNNAGPIANPVVGQIYFDTTPNVLRMFFWDGTTWVDMSGDIQDVLGGAGLTATTSANGDVITLDINVDNATIEVTGKLANSAVTTVKINGNAVTLDKIAQIANLRVLGNMSGATGNVSEVTVITDLANASSTTLATSSAIKSYVDANIGGLGNLEGAWAASSGYFPVGTDPVAGTKKGDYWYVTVAGTTGGVSFNIGDVIIAKVNDASQTLASDWIQLEVNRDQATETVLGLAEIATQVETDAGTDDQRIITPLKLKTLLDNRTGGYAANVGDTTSTSFALTHGLGTRDLIVAIYDNATYEEVITDVVLTSTSVVTVNFAVAPASNAYRVVIKK
jgi:hypothetical protein